MPGDPKYAAKHHYIHTHQTDHMYLINALTYSVPRLMKHISIYAYSLYTYSGTF